MKKEPQSGTLLSWRPRISIRARLTVTYTALIALTGTAMLVLIYAFMRYVPEYTIFAQAGTSTSEGSLFVSEANQEPPPDSTIVIFSPTDSTVLSINSEADIFNTLIQISGLALVLLTAVGAVICWIIAGRLVKPLQAINRAAQLAGTGSLRHRVGLAGPRDEIRNLSETFDEMLEKLDRAFQSHQRFAANASHELRTPLAATQTMLDVALSDPHSSAADLKSMAQRIREMNTRNIETVNALLDLADLGQLPRQNEPVDLAEMIEKLCTEMEPSMQERSITVHLSVKKSVAKGDDILLHQLLTNLLQNAVQHNISGGTITLATQENQATNTVELTVSNSGEVIAEETLTFLTEPFFRIHARTARPATKEQGRGLGLAIAAGIVEAHNGELILSAPKEGGLCVRVILPAG